MTITIIPKHPAYGVTRCGRVFTRANPRGMKLPFVPWRERKLITHWDGYKRVGLIVDGVQRLHWVHRLVLETFVGECPDGMEACHNDGNRANNHVDNLRWDTRKNNHADKCKHNTWQSGHRNGRAKLTDSEADVIVIEYLIFKRRQVDIARQFGIGQQTVSRIVNGKSYKICET